MLPLCPKRGHQFAFEADWGLSIFFPERRKQISGQLRQMYLCTENYGSIPVTMSNGVARAVMPFRSPPPCQPFPVYPWSHHSHASLPWGTILFIWTAPEAKRGGFMPSLHLAQWYLKLFNFLNRTLSSNWNVTLYSLSSRAAPQNMCLLLADKFTSCLLYQIYVGKWGVHWEIYL